MFCQAPSKVFFLKRFLSTFTICFVIGVLYTRWNLTLDCSNKSLQIELFREIQNLPIRDPLILDYLKCFHLSPPSTLPYNLSNQAGTTPSDHKDILAEMFRNKSEGFFIECGANDGEFLSNTLELERKGWTGLLVEALPELGEKLVNLNRKAWFADVCLSPYNNISEIEFAVSTVNNKWKDAVGKLVLPDSKLPNIRSYRVKGIVPCFPLESILAALEVTYVDYFSLDVEGVDLQVLMTLPFDETLVIDVISVEINHGDGTGKLVRDFLESKGYRKVLQHHHDAFYKRIIDVNATEARVTTNFQLMQ